MSSGSPTRPSIRPSSCYGRRPDLITLLGCAALALAAAAGAAQFTSGVNVVEVYAAVTDRTGQPIMGLTRDDFTVLEDGAAQTVSVFAAGDFPLVVTFGSAASNAPMVSVQR